MITVKNLVKRYKDVLALDHFSMQVEDGEIFGLLGPNRKRKNHSDQLYPVPVKI